MKFYCDKEDIPVLRYKCAECVAYDECQEDGYLEEIDTKYRKELQNVRNWIKKSRKDPKYKAWCLLKNKGPVNVDIVGPVPTIEEVSSVLEEYGYSFDPDAIWLATRRYFTRKAHWEFSPNPAEYKQGFEKIQEALEDLQEGFESVRNNTDLYAALQFESGVNLLDFSLSTSRLLECVKDIRTEESNKLPEYPLYRYIERLSSIYKKETGLEPTATDGQTTGNPSAFLMFVHTLLSEFHREVLSK